MFRSRGDADESTQRESNPHFRHGEPTGFRYIMGATILTGLSKSCLDLREARKPSSAARGGESEISNLRFEMLLFATVNCDLLQWDQRDLNSHLLG